jgi:prephenate dehydrogenase
MSIRIAIIGAGLMGGDHARIVAEDLPGATLNAWDGYRAAVVAEAGVEALQVGRRITIAAAEKPSLYNS